MEIIERQISELIQAEYNPRQLTEKQFKDLSNSIEKFGEMEPAIINTHKDRKNIIISGHQRLKVAESLHYESWPCIEVKLTLKKEQELNIRMNRNTGDWDWDVLANNFEVDDLKDWGFDDLSHIDLSGEEGLTDEDEVPEPPKEATAKMGDLYKLGEHRLLCGDSTNIQHVERLMDGEKADMVFTDPPYNVGFNGRSGKFEVIKNDDLSVDSFKSFIEEVCAVITIINPENYYVWCNWKFYGVLQGLLEFKSCIVWAKNVFGLGRGYRHQHEFCLFNGKLDEGINGESDLWEQKKDSNYQHPTQKPVELAERALSNHKDNTVILDLFGGSGSTLIACEKTNRKCRMMELDPIYIDVIIKRWEEYTGQKAELLTLEEVNG